MYVRLAFAVAAHLEPEILIVDEVLAVGDAAFQRKCLGKMKDVAGEGRTVLFVSHNMEAVQKLCNTGLFLRKGELVSKGPIDDVIKSYVQNGGESQNASFEVSRPADSESLPAYAMKVRVEDMEGNLFPEIPIGKPWRMTVQFRINKAMDHFVLGIGIVTMLDMPLMTTWSRPQKMKEGLYEMTASFEEIQLSSGLYKAVVGLSSEGRTFHFVDNLININISDVSDLLHDERIVNSKSGLLLNQSEFILKPL